VNAYVSFLTRQFAGLGPIVTGFPTTRTGWDLTVAEALGKHGYKHNDDCVSSVLKPSQPS